MDKTDFKKTDKPFYSAPADRWIAVDVPEWLFLSVDGQGDPATSPLYSLAVSALYSLSYGLKFCSKSVHGRDYVVGPLEGLWWADDMEAYRAGDRAAWKWRMMIRQPDWVTQADLAAARTVARDKIRKDLHAEAMAAKLDAVSLGTFEEGPSLQRLYFGPYVDEAPLLIDLHDRYLPENGYQATGLHHEIYL
ncbi:MAG: GyrI-like domain-containing protein, partial [Hoeflea sp.]|nr:GyrI-like domain-containing protein [Hoeflea sp.]